MDKSYAAEKISLLILLIASLLVLAGFLPIRLRMLGDIAVNVLRSAGADSVSVGAVSVVPWRGLSVRDVKAHKRINAREEYYVSVSRIDIDCNLISAAITVLTNSAVLKPDRDLFREAYEKPLVFAGDVGLLSVSFGPLKRVLLRDADIHFQKKEQRGKVETLVDGLSISGASATLNVRGGGGVKTLDGSVFAKETVIPHLAVVENFGAKMRVGGGRLVLADGSGGLFGGKVGAELSIGLDDMRIISGKLRVSGFDLERFCEGTNFSPGRLLGKLNIDAEIEEGSSAVFDSIKANGSASVTNLYAADIALQRTPAVGQLSKDLRTLRFREIKTGLQLADGKITFDEINAAGDIMKFKSVGWIDFEGRLRQDFEGELSADFVAALPRLIRNSLERTEDDGGRFKCRITGTFMKPRVDVDKSVYNRAFKNLFK